MLSLKGLKRHVLWTKVLVDSKTQISLNRPQSPLSSTYKNYNILSRVHHAPLKDKEIKDRET